MERLPAGIMMGSAAVPKGDKDRAAVFIDLENLVHAERQQADWIAAVTKVGDLMAGISHRQKVVLCVAVCDSGLARRLAVPLAGLGIRTHVHRGGRDAADKDLESRLERDIPSSCSTVVIASGDHFFTRQATRLKQEGMRVEVAAHAGCISAELYKAASAFRNLSTTASTAMPDQRSGSMNDLYEVSLRFTVRADSAAEAERQVLDLIKDDKPVCWEDGSPEFGTESFEGGAWLVEKGRHLSAVKTTSS